jgi:glucose/arabinose dehydrogenase
MRKSIVSLITSCSLLGSIGCTDGVDPLGARRLTAPNTLEAALGPSPMASPKAIGVEVVAAGLVSPVFLAQAPGKHGRRYVVDQIGKIWELRADGGTMPGPFLDISSKITPLNPGYDERGLLGLAFHPDFEENGRFFVFYNSPPRPGTPSEYNNTVVISEFRANGHRANAGSERVVLEIPHPQANHNGGTIAFGPDGYLYISVGDGGGANDVGLGHVADWYEDNAGGNGQDVSINLLGSILRIDVDGGTPYGIPADNPFVGTVGLDEIWAYGFRNPYRFSFDMGGSHSLLAGDAGQELWEEVSLVVRRGNYGWNVKEGTHCFDAENPTVSPETCPDVDPVTGETLRDPVIEFANTKAGGPAFTVVGGVVYRGTAVPTLAGEYVFGGATASFTSPDGRLFGADPTSGDLWTMYELLINGTDRLNHVVKGFGQDANGEVYVLGSLRLGPTGATGKVFRIVEASGP